MLVNLFIILYFVMLGGAVVLRLWTKTLPPVRLNKVSPPVALQLVGEFLDSSYDGQFGFPTGVFEVTSPDPGHIIAREIVGSGSHFTEILRRFYNGLFRFLLVFGLVGFAIGLFLAFFLTPVLLWAALNEVLTRRLLRSQITADLRPVDNGTEVTFGLRGVGALIIGKRVRAAFHPPELPPRIASLAGLAPTTATP